MTCCNITDSKYYIPYSIDGILKEVSDPFSNYRTMIKTDILKIMSEYRIISDVAGEDVPMISYDPEESICSVMFRGSSTDLELIEDYLRTRSIYV